MMTKHINILDCTLRDGGLGLYDAYLNGYSQTSFSGEQKDKVAALLTQSGLDIIELGCIEKSDKNNENFAIYQNIEDISKKIPSNKNPNQLFAALYRGPDTPVDEIPRWQEGLCPVVRVIIRYSELKKSVDFCASLAQKGYKVCIQPMLTMRYTDEEINYILDSANSMKAYAVYFVDSYGYMKQTDIARLFHFYHKKLSEDIYIGFHAHNNMNLAFSNVLDFLNLAQNRKVILDSCICGLGQGAGNLQTELIVPELNSLGKKYDYNAVLDACEEIEPYCGNNQCGYSVTNLLPALHKAAYKYAVSMRRTYGLSYAEINYILKNIPDDLRHRYTKENLLHLLEMFNYQNLGKK